MVRIIGLTLVVIVVISWAAGSTGGMETTGETLAPVTAARQWNATPLAGCDVASELPAFHFILEPAPEASSNPDLVMDAWRTLTTRLGTLGTEPIHDRLASNASVVEPPYADQIVVSLKRIGDHDGAEQLLQEVGFFKVIDPGPIPLQVGDDIRTPVANDESTPITIIDSHDINPRYVFLVPNETGRHLVVFGFNNAEANQTYAGFVAEKAGEPIPMVVDDRVIAAPTLPASLPAGYGVVAGLEDVEASILALEMKSGPLAIPLLIVEMVPLSASELCYGDTGDGATG